MDSILLILKIIHILGFVAWVGGLFYLANIMVYHRKAMDQSGTNNTDGLLVFEKIENGVYKKMCNPAMMLTWTAGLLMVFYHGMDWFKENLWLHHKLLLLVLLTVFQLLAKKQIKKLQTGTYFMTTLQFKFFNAIPVLFLFAIVVLAVFRNTDPLVSPIIVVFLAIALLFIFAKVKKPKKPKKTITSNQNT
jgi:protoporphyrinogen IX oxidase